jgi:hypothetical protein
MELYKAIAPGASRVERSMELYKPAPSSEVTSVPEVPAPDAPLVSLVAELMPSVPTVSSATMWSERMQFLIDYSTTMNNMIFHWMKKYGIVRKVNLRDILHDIQLKTLSSRTWYDKKHKTKSKLTTYLFIVVRNGVVGFIRKHYRTWDGYQKPKEVLMSDLTPADRARVRECMNGDTSSYSVDCLDDYIDSSRGGIIDARC